MFPPRRRHIFYAQGSVIEHNFHGVLVKELTKVKIHFTIQFSNIEL